MKNLECRRSNAFLFYFYIKNKNAIRKTDLCGVRGRARHLICFS